ncbi:MAG: Lacal_2735 family protein [Saprospiraceae bacterium]|nr:Lacal_2735 family protein [Saprospiraceae bacterium]
MFGWLFKKKTEREKLELEYKRLMVESYELSKVDRTASDAKVAEADKISKMIDELDAKAAEVQ